ncbi:MAG: hypothetical protein MI757_18235, partial [Pirellulales bacterium]|nr:hypothetical protein [Pirellulales bacterium]
MRTQNFAILVVLVAVCGCSKAPEPRPPREDLVSGGQSKLPPGPVTREQWQDAREDIFKRRQQVETLYLTEDGRHIIRAGIDRAIVAPDTGKLAWKAWQCENPSCPGRNPDGSPLLFPWPDHLLYAKEDGTVGMRQPSTEEDFEKDENYGVQKCPECLKLRVLAAETDEQR